MDNILLLSSPYIDVFSSRKCSLIVIKQDEVSAAIDYKYIKETVVTVVDIRFLATQNI
jgi:hypothetical protein